MCKKVNSPFPILLASFLTFKALITFSFKDSTANAKSVLSVLGACVKSGDEIEISCQGADEEDALRAMIKLVEGGLGE